MRNGDVVTTTCVYDSMDKTEATPGGLGSQEEMCVMFLLVYPSDCRTPPPRAWTLVLFRLQVIAPSDRMNPQPLQDPHPALCEL